ncbi:lysis protein [Pseudomonas reactans]|uniref:lysis system i-spanin subunit Rz n=1 Tax=Pseudomonas reactans TaxID=117680 RepID=UPI0015A338A1|nr:lysis system i-spanin subunit Rz [Pseudomonas reactans]NWF16974.1 lysis protein [Pseudomonas reactans]
MRFLVAIGVCVLVVVVWQVQAWRYGTQIERLSAAQTQKALHLQQAEQDRRLALEQQLSAIDQQHARELSDAQRTQAALRDRIASADVRLSVLLDASSGCPMPAATATAAGSVVHAAPRARLDPAHAQRIIRITDDGDSALIALRACQAYVRAIAR